jgi:hypothetical protein
MAEQFANDAATTLAASVNTTATTITVAGTVGFPNSGNFRIRIDSELMLVTGVSGTTWTVTRAVEPVGGSQAAANHNAGADVNHVLTAASLPLAVPYSNPEGQANSEAFGASATVAAAKQAVFGEGANCDSGAQESVAVGYAAYCHGAQFGVALGGEANITANHAIAIGCQAGCSGDSGVAIGNAASVSINNGVLIGNSNTLTSGTLILGAGNTCNAVYAVALGFGLTITHKGAVALGQALASTRQRELIIGCDTGNGAGSWLNGHRVRVQGTPSDNNLYDIGIIDFQWANSTAATREGRIVLYAIDYNGTREGLRVESDGSNPRVGFLGAAAQPVQNITGSKGGNAALANLLSALVNLGLITDSTT